MLWDPQSQLTTGYTHEKKSRLCAGLIRKEICKFDSETAFIVPYGAVQIIGRNLH